MIDKWFIDDANRVLREHKRLVITDTRGEGAFLIKYLSPRRCRILTVADSTQELKARIDAERDYRDKNVVFYTTIPQAKLTMLQEYATTCGCIVLDDMETYIKQQLNQNLGINSNVDGRKLVLAAKVSKDKDENWWRGVAEGIINPVDAETLLRDFLRDPKAFKDNSDDAIYEAMQGEASRIMGMPTVDQKPKVFAQGIMNSFFVGMMSGTPNSELLKLYHQMADSESMNEQLRLYIQGFQLPEVIDVFACHFDHPFNEIDKAMFRAYSKMLQQGESTLRVHQYVSQRLNSDKAIKFKPSWLKDLLVVISFDIGSPHEITDLEGFAEYYKNTFAPLDTAMRHLYEEWLNEPAVIRPVQEFYEQMNGSMLSCWFSLVDNYQPTQFNLIKQCFDQAPGKTAIIVCDGLRLEMAEVIAKRTYPSGTRKDQKTAWCKLPSVTPNGMSSLYGIASAKDDSASKRQTSLKTQLPDVEIMQLNNLNNGITANHLVLLYGDIDQIGEHKQLAGLRDIATYETELHEKIKELLNMGYQSVFLTTDHGYVITGLLDESHKLDAPNGTHANERFATSDEPISDSSFIKRNDDWIEGHYQYYARTDKPFRTPGGYGYSHGGLTPQECLIPVYRFFNDQNEVSMPVTIVNKADLATVTGQFYTIKLQGGGNQLDVFASERKIKLLFFDSHGTEVNQSPIITIRAGEQEQSEYSLTYDLLKLVVIDALTTEQLDSCNIEKQVSRDIEDLF